MGTALSCAAVLQVITGGSGESVTFRSGWTMSSHASDTTETLRCVRAAVQMCSCAAAYAQQEFAAQVPVSRTHCHTGDRYTRVQASLMVSISTSQQQLLYRQLKAMCSCRACMPWPHALHSTAATLYACSICKSNHPILHQLMLMRISCLPVHVSYSTLRRPTLRCQQQMNPLWEWSSRYAAVLAVTAFLNSYCANVSSRAAEQQRSGGGVDSNRFCSHSCSAPNRPQSQNAGAAAAGSACRSSRNSKAAAGSTRKSSCRAH